MPTFARVNRHQFTRDFNEALDIVIARGQEFSVEDVWIEYLAVDPLREARSPDVGTPGSILIGAAKRGRIVNTGRNKLARRGPAKGRRLSVWMPVDRRAA